MRGHVGIDPDCEIITAPTVSPGNAGDASVAADLITDLLETDTAETETLRQASGMLVACRVRGVQGC